MSSRKRIVTALCSLFIVLSLVPLQPAHAQTGDVSEVAKDVTAPSSGGKYPDIDAAGSTVHLAGNPDDRASYWSKTDSATSWSSRTTLGDAGGQADYSSAAVAVSPDGSRVCVAWIDRDSSGIYSRCKSGSGNFGSERRIASADGFGIFIKLAITSAGRVFAVWNADGLFRYSVSSDGGNNWSGRRTVSDRTAFGAADIDTGPNGELMVGFYSEGRVYAGIWNGNSFDVTRVDRGGNYFADPTVTIAANGRYYIAWRGIDNGEIWYAERQSNGSWPNSRLASGGETFGFVSIASDAQSNLYVFWINNRSGSTELYSAFKPLTSNWVGPRQINVSGFVVNVDAAASLTGGNSYGHAAYEAFTGGDVRIRYTLLSARVQALKPAIGITLNDGAAQTNSSNVTVDVNVLEGTPDQVQLSNDGTTFADYVAITENIPWALAPPEAGTNACVDRTVYARARDADAPDLVSDIASDTIQLDQGVDAMVSVRNPYLRTNPPVYVEGELLDSGSEGARDGDPRYTRIPVYFLEVRGETGECSGLSRVAVGTTQFGILNNYYANVGALPNPETPFENRVTVVVQDNAGNERSYEGTIYVDTAPPVVSAGTPEVVDTTGQTISTTTSILVSLKFTDVQIADVGYGEQEDKPFWGVWLANSTDPIDVADKGALDNLDWSAVHVPSAQESNGSYTFTVRNWSVFSGLPDDQRVGNQNINIYARALDGAGNASETTLRFQVQLAENFTVPTLDMPIVER